MEYPWAKPGMVLAQRPRITEIMKRRIPHKKAGSFLAVDGAGFIRQASSQGEILKMLLRISNPLFYYKIRGRTRQGNSSSVYLTQTAASTILEHTKRTGDETMGYQDDYVMRTISDLVRAIAGLALGKRDIDYELPESEEQDTEIDRTYRRLKGLVDEGKINEAENLLSDVLDPESTQCLEMALTLSVATCRFDTKKWYICLCATMMVF